MRRGLLTWNYSQIDIQHCQSDNDHRRNDTGTKADADGTRRDDTSPDKNKAVDDSDGCDYQSTNGYQQLYRRSRVGGTK